MAKAHGEQVEATTSRREREKYQAKKPPRAGRSKALEKRKGDAQRGRGYLCVFTHSVNVVECAKKYGFDLTQKKKP